MNLDAYQYKTSERYLDHEFYSEGPRGKIKKVIRHTPRNAGGITYFNLGFGDWFMALRKKGKFTNGRKFMITATKPKNKRSDHTKKKGKSVVRRKVRDYGNEPFFIKKADESQAFLEKHGFPEELLHKG
jgi:hypothetical protein